MKIWIVFCLLLLAAVVSCSHQEEASDHEIREIAVATPAYMTRLDVLEEVKALAAGRPVMDGPLSPEEKERERNLIPDPAFLDGVPPAPKGLVRSELPSNLPQEVDLRFRDTPVKTQDNGKCTAYAGTAAVESTLQKDKLIPGLDLSDWHSWSFYRRYSSEAFIKAITKNRIGDEKDFPQYGSAKANLLGHTLIAKQTYLDDDVASVAMALAKGNVVYLAMKTPKEMLRCAKVISPKSKASSGGHALLISGYYLEGGKVIAIIKNSWGKDCGDHGYQYLPLEICHKKGFYCNFWEIEAVDRVVGVDPAPLPLPSQPPAKKVCTRKWWAPWIKTCVEVISS